MNEKLCFAASVAPPLRLGAFPTPLEAAPRLAAALGVASLHVKREDLSGPALGGNKIRQLDLLLEEIRQDGSSSL